MLSSLKKTISRFVLGEPVQDWGVVHEAQTGFFEEQLRLSLHRKDGRHVLCLTTKHSSSISRNSFTFAIPVPDLRLFVSRVGKNYDRLRHLEHNPTAAIIDPADRLPLAQRLMLSLIHGIRASVLLVKFRDYRFYGYITRRSMKKILIQSGSEGHVISGEALEAMLQALSEFLAGEPGQAAARKYGMTVEA